MKSDSLNASIHRLLIIRLGVATTILSLLFAAIAYFNNQSRLENAVVELTRLRTNQFNLYIRDLLDSPEPLAAEVLERRLQRFIAESGKAIVSDGQFVMKMTPCCSNPVRKNLPLSVRFVRQSMKHP